MLLTKLTVQNFGQFRDKHTFDLATKDEFGNTKPIILFGGKNGAGKTTLFEAFQLCLYGNNLPDFRVRKSNYQDYIRSKIHRSSRLVLQPVTASITLEFEYALMGQVRSYVAERRWHRREQGVEEEFHVSVDNKELEEVETTQWQDFIKELIPIGVSKLFFFDGEQIQALAEERTDEVHLKDSFYSLLGLDLVDRLQSDLKIRLSKSMKEADAEFGKELDSLEEELEKLEKEREGIVQENAHLKTVQEIRKKTIAKIEDKLAKEGGGFVKRRDELMKERSKLESDINQIYREISELAEGLLPFAFVPGYCKSLKKRLVEEDNFQSEIATASRVKKSLKSVETQVVSSLRKSVKGDSGNKKIIRNITDIFEKHYSDLELSMPRKGKESIKIINHLSSSEKNKILAWIDSAVEEVPNKMKYLSTRLDKLTIQLQRTGAQLSKIPSDDVVGPIVKELNALHQEIGGIDSTIKANLEKMKSIDYKLQHVNARIKERLKDKKKFEKMGRGTALAQRVQVALEEYETRLKKEKLLQLSEVLIECLSELMHKELFYKAEINPETFSVTLFDKENNAIPKDELSAGEKQMYAIAILWALARTSGRPLPFIVDTPLGRLDSDHRLNLVQNFFPVASHQVIIFSTDTEVDEKYFEELQRDIAKSYKLEYDKNEGKTKIEAGYFWKTKQESEVALTK